MLQALLETFWGGVCLDLKRSQSPEQRLPRPGVPVLHLDHGAAGLWAGAGANCLAEHAAGCSAGTKPQKGHCQSKGLFWENGPHKEGLFCCEMRPCFSSSRGWALPAHSGCRLAGDAACSPVAADLSSLPGIFSAFEVLHRCSQQHSACPQTHSRRKENEIEG